MTDGAGSRTGSRFGPYELRSLLGRGGMGEVYAAYDTVKDRTVALKLLPAALGSDPEYQERFRREARTAARLQEPHVIPIHDFGEIDGVLYIDMRLVRGRDLRAVLRAHGRLEPARAIAVISQVAAALDAAHADGLVHRDVKPENIMLTDDDFAYLADFGIASRVDDSKLTAHGSAIGSMAYMAPERFDDVPVTARSDVYSLGCVLHECLTGATPYTARTVSAQMKAHLYEPPPLLSSALPGAPPALDQVLQRALAKDPRDRQGSAGELARAASAAVGGSGARRSQPNAVTQLRRTDALPVGEPGVPERAPGPPRDRSSGRLAALALVGVAVVVAGGLALRPLLSGDSDDAGAGAASLQPAVVQSATSTGTSSKASPATPPPSSPSSSTAAPASSSTASSASSAPSSAPPTTISPSSSRTGLGLSGPGYDNQGWASPRAARCNATDPAVLVAASTTTQIAICETGVGDYYYRGYSTKSGNGIEIGFPERTATGWRATNKGVTYDIEPTQLTISQGSTSLLQEPMSTYADGS